MLEAGDSALDVVTEAVRLLEECPLFNAGIGSSLRAMKRTNWTPRDGRRHPESGAVAGVSRLRNPALAARLVTDYSPRRLRSRGG
ncbi:isoaspartyl peptidase/L-asparaginase [Shigella flexneri]